MAISYSRLFHGFDCIDRNFRTDPRAHVVNFQHRPDPVRHYVRDVCTDFLYYSAVRPEPVRDHGYAQADHDAGKQEHPAVPADLDCRYACGLFYPQISLFLPNMMNV